MNSLFLLLLGTFSLGLAETLNGHLLKRYEKITSVGLLVIGSLVTLVISSCVIVITRQEIQLLSLRDIVLILFVGFLYYLGNKLFYNSFKVQEASTSTVIVMSSIVVTTIFGKVVFAEEVSTVQWLGIVLIVLSVMLTNIGGLSVDRLNKVFRPTKVTKQVLLAAFLYGLANSTSKLIVQNISPVYYQFLDALLVTPLIFLIDWKEVKEQGVLLVKTKAFRLLGLVIPFYYIYNFIKYIVYEQGMALPIVDSVDNAVVFVIIVLELLLFNIKPENLSFKLITTTIAVSGVLLLSLQ